MSRYFKGIIKKSYHYINVGHSFIVNMLSKLEVPANANNYKILKMKNKYKGKRCFIIGNGPSLKPQDLERLKEEFTFASNKIYKIFNETTWRPTFYMVVDSIVLEENLKEINLIQTKNKFTLKNYKQQFDADVYFNNNLVTSKLKSFSTNIMESLYSSGTVSYHMLQIAYYMGFSEVYLLGHDYNYKGAVSKTMDLSFLKNETKMYFSDDYINPKGHKREPAALEIYNGMEKVRIVFESSNRKVFNASRVSYLDVFEFTNFEELFGDNNDKFQKKIN